MNDTGKALLSVLDKALQKTEADQTPQTTAFLTELHRTTGGTKRNWPHGLLLDGRAVKFSDLTVEQIAATAPVTIGGLLCSPDEITTLREIQSRMDATLEQAKKFSLSGVSDHLHGIRDKMAADVAAGEPLPAGVIMPSRESVQHDFRARQNALIGLLVKITHEEVVPLAKLILQKFSDTVDGFLRDTEEADRATCEAYDLDYEPSLLWKAAASVAMRYTPASRIPIAGAWRTPKQILEGIIEI
jgi:hypothetical protein